MKGHDLLVRGLSIACLHDGLEEPASSTARRLSKNCKVWLSSLCCFCLRPAGGSPSRLKRKRGTLSEKPCPEYNTATSCVDGPGCGEESSLTV